MPSKQILASEESRMIEQANFIYSPLGKALEKQTKTNKDQEKNELKQLMSMSMKKILQCLWKRKKYMIELLIKGVLNFKNCGNKLIVIIQCIISDEKETKSFIIDFKAPLGFWKVISDDDTILEKAKKWKSI